MYFFGEVTTEDNDISPQVTDQVRYEVTAKNREEHWPPEEQTDNRREEDVVTENSQTNLGKEVFDQLRVRDWQLAFFVALTNENPLTKQFVIGNSPFEHQHQYNQSDWLKAVMIFPLNVITQTESIVAEVAVFTDDVGVSVVFEVVSTTPGVAISNSIPVEFA